MVNVKRIFYIALLILAGIAGGYLVLIFLASGHLFINLIVLFVLALVSVHALPGKIRGRKAERIKGMVMVVAGTAVSSASALFMTIVAGYQDTPSDYNSILGLWNVLAQAVFDPIGWLFIAVIVLGVLLVIKGLRQLK